jgi:hypothetical protein
MKMEQKNTETQSAAQQQNKLKDGSLYKDGKGCFKKLYKIVYITLPIQRREVH